MLMPKKARIAIYSYLFKEGVCVAENNTHIPKHPNIEVPNLYVIKLMRSLKSRGYVTQNFCWNHYYWYLTNEGIEYLREYLHLESDIVPNTLKKPKSSRPEGFEARRPRGDRGDRGDRGAAGGKDVGPSAPFRPNYPDRPYGRGRGGGGRGRGDYYRGGRGRGGQNETSGGPPPDAE
eukprot:TRINITY_DN168_c0_g1_i1.p1 TRINITY_DN168_c0_g1~~TRINITY_DN168_c0_g1_i1.p1  ORF type:complete len:177 (+),score=27.10 TRINITY_DN168_c0_g1_i1:70-600(+)